MGYNEKALKGVYKYLLVPLLTADPSPTEALLSLVALWWGVILTIPIPLDAEFYKFLLMSSPRHIIAVLFLAIGSGIGIGRLFRITNFERFFVFLSVGLWSYVAVLLLITRPLSLAAFGTYALLALSGGWAYWRTRYD